MPPPSSPRSARALSRLVIALLAASLGAGLLAPGPSTAQSPAGSDPSPSALPTLPPIPGLPGDEEEDEDDPRAEDFPPMPRRCATREEQIPHTPMKCTLIKAGRNRPTLVLWGDSHLWMMLPAIRKALAGRKVNLVGFLFGGCVPARPDMEVWAGQPCAETADLANRYLAKQVKRGARIRVILGSYWGAQLHRVYYYPSRELEDASRRRRDYVMSYTRPLFRWLGRQGIPTDVLFQGPAAVPPDPDCQPGPTPFECDIPRSRAYYKQAELRGFLQRGIKRLPRGARLIDYSNAVCSPRTCAARQPGGAYTWYDPYHLSTSTTTRLARFFVPSVKRLLRR